jgi:amidase
MDDLIRFNEQHPEAIPYGQSLLLAANQTGGVDDSHYLPDRARDIALSLDGGIRAALAVASVDFLVAPMGAAAKCTGKAGAPVVAIPAGLSESSVPFGIALFGEPGDDQRLLAAAELIEREIGDRRMPSL